MASFPYMQFQATNPLDKAIKTAMEVYSAPAELAQKEAQTSLFQQQAEKEKMLVQLLGGANMGGGVGSQGNVSGGIGGYNEMSDQLLRHYLGLPSEFPGERTQRERETHQENTIFNKQLEKAQGTSAQISNEQNVVFGVDNTIPVIDELIAFDIPSQVGKGGLSPNKQATYMSLVAGGIESLTSAMNLGTSDSAKEVAKAQLERQTFESEKNYKERLGHLKKDLLDRKKRALGQGVSEGSKSGYGLGNSGKVRIQAPDGTIRMVPSALVEAAIKAGGKRVEF